MSITHQNARMSANARGSIEAHLLACASALGLTFNYRASRVPLEHPVGVCGGFGDGLAHVPMFDNLSVFKPEDFHDRQPQFVGLKLDVDMEYHKVTVGEDPFDIAAKSGELLFQVLQQRAKSLDPILAPRIVLDEMRSEIGRGFVDVRPVQGRIVERQDGPFVSLADIVCGERGRGAGGHCQTKSECSSINHHLLLL
jgi:hypothetical protein